MRHQVRKVSNNIFVYVRNGLDLVCPWHALSDPGEGTSCGEWCPFFELQINQTNSVPPKLTLLCSHNIKTIILDQDHPILKEDSPLD